MRKLIARAIVPPGWQAKGSVFVSTLSLIALIHHGFNVGLFPTLLLLIEYYDKALDVLVSSWAKPLIEAALLWLFNLQINLYPHWKHIFVLLTLYFFSGARVEYKSGRRLSAFVRLLLGFIVALGVAILVGRVPISQSDIATNFQIAAIPLLGIAFNDIFLRAWRGTFTRAQEAERLHQSVPTWWSYLRPAFYGVLVRTILGLAIVYGGLNLPAIRQFTSPGLALLGLLVVLLAAHQIYLGARELKSLRQDGENWEDTALRSRGIMIGLTMLGVFFWSAVVLGLNVGKQILGL